MSKKTIALNFDDGLTRLDINGNGTLVFNASDLNMYDRFMKLLQDLPEIEKQYTAKVEARGEAIPEGADSVALAGEALSIARDIDGEIKNRLNLVFGHGADFDQLLDGVNCMAIAGNGQRVLANLLEALTPYISAGVEKQLQGSLATAKANRAQRRALNKGERKA